jgi:hypothetical protein
MAAMTTRSLSFRDDRTSAMFTIATTNAHAAARSVVDAIGLWYDAGQPTPHLYIGIPLHEAFQWLIKRHCDAMHPPVPVRFTGDVAAGQGVLRV